MKELLVNREKGISSLIFCAKPEILKIDDKETVQLADLKILAINSLMFIFNSFDERVDIALQPKYHIVVNDISKQDKYYQKSDRRNNQGEFDYSELSVDDIINHIRN